MGLLGFRADLYRGGTVVAWVRLPPRSLPLASCLSSRACCTRVLSAMSSSSPKPRVLLTASTSVPLSVRAIVIDRGRPEE